MLHFDVIVRRVMALSLEKIIWYNFNCFLHVEIFVEEPFFPAKKLQDEGWEVGLQPLDSPYQLLAGISPQNLR